MCSSNNLKFSISEEKKKFYAKRTILLQNFLVLTISLAINPDQGLYINFYNSEFKRCKSLKKLAETHACNVFVLHAIR